MSDKRLRPHVPENFNQLYREEIEGLIDFNLLKKSKRSIFVDFMHKIGQTVKKKCEKNFKISIFEIWLLMCSTGLKLIPNHSVTPLVCSEANFDTMDTF